MLQTNLAARRTPVRHRANKTKATALILLGLFVLHLFFYPLKMSCKKTFVFLQPLLICVMLFEITHCNPTGVAAVCCFAPIFCILI